MLRLEILVAGIERAQTIRRQQAISDDVDDPSPVCLIEHGMAQGEREDLIRSQRGIVARFPIDDVEEILAVRKPEPAVERRARAIRESIQLGAVAVRIDSSAPVT